MDKASNNFDKEEIIRIEFGIREKEISNKIVVIPLPFEALFPKDIEKRLKEFEIDFEWYKVPHIMLKNYKGNLFLRRKNKKGFIMFLGRGLIDFTERIRLLCSITKVKEILFIGSAASLDEKIKPLEFNIPLYVVPFENVSTVYSDFINDLPIAHKTLWKRIINLVKEEGCIFHTKLHATIPFIYMETKRFLEYLKDVGISTIDMEVSGLFRIANHYKKKAAALLVVWDTPLFGEVKVSEDLIEKTKEKTLKIALKFLDLV